MSITQITPDVRPASSTAADTDPAIAVGIARRRSYIPYIAVTAVASVLAVAGFNVMQTSQTDDEPTLGDRTPATATVDLSQVYGPTLAELKAEPVGCTITLKRGDTGAELASEVLGGEDPYGYAIVPYINEQGEGTGSTEGMLMEGQDVDLPLRYCGDRIDQTPQEG